MLRRVRARYWAPVTLFGSSLLTSCALFGYDFDSYGPAPADRSSGGAGGPGKIEAPNEAGDGGRRPHPKGTASGGIGSAPGASSSLPSSGAGGDSLHPEGGDGGAGGCLEGGAAGRDSTGDGDVGIETVCLPTSCLEQSKHCGPTTDGCGHPLDCGGCTWWFEDCIDNECRIAQ